jgi:hypothetical protein
MAELRHNGRYIESFESEAAAHAYLTERSKREGDGFNAAHWSVEPDRAVRLLCGGNVIETFADHAGASEHLAARLKSDAEQLGTALRPNARGGGRGGGALRRENVYRMDPPPPPPAAPQKAAGNVAAGAKSPKGKP